MDSCYSALRFSDADEHAQSLMNFGQRYYQIEKGAFQSSLQQADFNGLHIFAESTNRRIVESVQTSPAMVVLGWTRHLDSTPHAPFISFAPAGHERLVHLPANVELTGVTIQVEEFERLADLLEFTAAQHRNPTIWSMRNSKAFPALQSSMAAIDGHARNLASPQAKAMFRKQFLDQLFCALDDASSLRRPNLTWQTYDDIVRRSQSLVLSSPESPPSVLDLCMQLRVSRRTLQKSFIQVTQHTPTSYLRHVRLGGVRRLLRSRPAAQLNISEAAARWGFFHLGHFSRDYRLLFGELPSQTQRIDATSITDD